jgi:hypothetical protein
MAQKSEYDYDVNVGLIFLFMQERIEEETKSISFLRRTTWL